MKKLLSLLLTALLVFTNVGCTTTKKESSTKTSSKSSAKKTTKKNSGKTLVAYYSATGNTKEVAKTIAETTNGDLFEITPVDVYTDDDLDWTDSKSRVSVEHNDESKRDVALKQTTPDNWDNYDTVYIGYPIWWGIAAWPVNGFVTGNNFEGKTVIPFCTSSSSGMGQSGKLLEKAAKTGNWLEGKRFSSGASSSDIKDWINNI